MDWLKNQHRYTNKDEALTIISDYRGYIKCDGCKLHKFKDQPFFNATDLVVHLKEHIEAGDKVSKKLLKEETYLPEHFNQKYLNSYTKKQQNILDDAEFNACKFGSNHEPLPYDPIIEDLEHIRYKERKHYSFAKKTKKGISLYSHSRKTFGNSKRENEEKNPFKKVRREYLFLKSCISLQFKKNSDHPDAAVNGNLYHWDEDAIYAVYFQPLVGMEVLKFLQAEPDHPWAQKIMKTMEKASSESFKIGKEIYQKYSENLRSTS